MSKNMGLFVLFVLGSIGLVILWASAIFLGLLGSLVARNLRPLTAAAVMLAFIAGAPVLSVALVKLNQYSAETQSPQSHRAL
jgi:hypothetical protein